MPSFTTYDGTRLSCRVLGERPGANPVVCLPGGPLRATSYLGDLGGLDGVRELVLVELPHRRVDRLVADIEALRVHLDQDRLDLLAHSEGGTLALLYAAEHPDRIARLALVAPGTAAVGLDGCGSDGRRDAAPPALAPVEETQPPPDAERIYYADGALDPEATRPALAEVETPVLVLAGELDPEPTPDRARQVAALFPRAEVAVQPGAGHFPWLDDPAAFGRVVQGFFTP